MDTYGIYFRKGTTIVFQIVKMAQFAAYMLRVYIIFIAYMSTERTVKHFRGNEIKINTVCLKKEL